MHFFKDNDQVTRMKYRLNELCPVLLPDGVGPGIRVFKQQYEADVKKFLTTALKQKTPRIWPEMEAVKSTILSNPRLSTAEKQEWTNFFDNDVPSGDVPMVADKCIKWLLPDIVKRKKEYIESYTPPVPVQPVLMQSHFRTLEPVHHDEVIIHPGFTRAAARARAREREQHYADMLQAEKEAMEAHSTDFEETQQTSSFRNDADTAPISDDGETQEETQEGPVDTISTQLAIVDGSSCNEMTWEGSVLHLNDNVVLLPTIEGREADRKAGYDLLFNIGNVLAFNMQERKVHVHWYYATKMEGHWRKWIGRDDLPYKDWVHASSLVTDRKNQIIRVKMLRVTARGCRGKTKLDKVSLKLMTSLKAND